MKFRNLLFSALCPCLLQVQAVNYITGPLCVYHVSPGYTCSCSLGTDSILLQNKIRFGDMAISNQANDYGFDFAPDIDSCLAGGTNRIFGVLLSP